jgi:hypothetical protein
LWTPARVSSPQRRHEQAIAQVRYSTSRLQALQQATRLLGHYPNARPPDPEAYLNGLAEIFEHYPLGIVEQCCDVFFGIAATERFPPSPSEVRRWCDLYTAAALAIVRRGPPQPERAPYSDEHCATMRGRLQKLLHELFDRNGKMISQ